LCLGGLPSWGVLRHIASNLIIAAPHTRTHHAVLFELEAQRHKHIYGFEPASKHAPAVLWVVLPPQAHSAATNTIPRLHPMAMPPHHNTAENCTTTANARSGKFVATGAVSSAVSARKVLKTLGGGWWAKQPGETEGAIAAPTISPPVCALGWLAGGRDGGQRRAYRAVIEGLPGSCWRKGAGCCGRARWHGRQACPPPVAAAHGDATIATCRP